MFFEKTSEVLD